MEDGDQAAGDLEVPAQLNLLPMDLQSSGWRDYKSRHSIGEPAAE